MNLLPKQNNAVYYLKDKKTKEILYGGAAGGGKSALGCLWLIESCQKYKCSRWLMGRSKQKTLKETTLNTFFQLAAQLKVTDQFDYNQQKGVITWNNGSEILLKDLFLYPSDPEFDSLGSLEITGAFIDECNQIVYKAWQVVSSRIRYKIKEFGITPKMLGTCNPAKNWTYQKFYKPSKDGTLPPNRMFIQSLPTDNPNLPESYLQSLLELDSASRERLYYGNWEYDDDPAALCSFESICDMFTNDFVEHGKKYITADIALHGSDKFVMGVWSGWRLEKIVSIDKCDADEVTKAIQKLATDEQVPRSNIAYDADGLGSFLRGYLRNAKPFVNNSKPIEVKGQKENYENLQAQCAYYLSKQINNNAIFAKSEQQKKDLITQELEQLKRKNVDKDGKLGIIPKDVVKQNIGRSPDYRDMMLMRAVFDIKPKSKVLA